VFFNRDVEERSQPSIVIRTIAYRLASFDARIGAAITKVIEAMPTIAESPLPFQFMKLVIEPLSTLPKAEAPIILILDALDECGSPEDRRSLLTLLAAESIHLPPFVRVVVTSRTEFDIRRALEDRSHVLIQEMELASEDNSNDILTFLRNRMSEIRSKNTSLSLPHDWPGDAAIYALHKRAAGLFVWASTACRFIDGHDPRCNIDTILRSDVNHKAESALDSLYRTALKSVVADMCDDEYFRADFHSIVGTILVARNPISDQTIDSLLSLDRPSRHSLLKMGCVIHWSYGEPVRILHPSFADFLSNLPRCHSDMWYIDMPLHNRLLAVRCLHYLESMLRRNICDLNLTGAPVDMILPEAIVYACSSWIDHICAITEEVHLVGEILERFLFRHLLHWLEVMGIVKQSRTVIISVRSLLDWLHVCDSILYLSVELIELR